VLEHDANCDPAESIRIRLSLHAGDVIEGEGEWAGQPVIAACRLVNSAVIRRVLAAAAPSPLALIVSDDWYAAVVKEGYASGQGYQQVWVQEKTFGSLAWVKGPGRTSPPGLRPEDDPGRRHQPPAPQSPAEQVPARKYVVKHGNLISDSTFEGDVVFGNKYGNSDPTSRGGAR